MKGNLMTVFDSRRAFLRHGTLLLTGTALKFTAVNDLLADTNSTKPAVRAGLITDLHYADKPRAGTRYYRQSLTKLVEASKRFERNKTGFVVELGDFIDAADSVKTELGYLKTVNRAFSEISGERHYVLGNHCVYTLTKQEFLDGVGQKKSYFSFDKGGFHFVVLDSCFRSDGKPYGRKNFKWTDPNIPRAELDWMRSDLKKTKQKTIVFAHQRLDVSNHYGVKNAKAVRKVLEESGHVIAVFQGHSHRNDYRQIAGIHYCTLVAMVEGTGVKNSGYSLMDVFSDGTIRVTGYRNQKKYGWSPARSGK